MKIQEIPNPKGKKVKVGDRVKITSGEWAGYIGEVVGFVEKGKNWIETIKVITDNGGVEFVEVTNVVVEFVKLLEDIGKSNVFKKFWKWLKNIFKKKKKKNKD